MSSHLAVAEYHYHHHHHQGYYFDIHRVQPNGSTYASSSPLPSPPLSSSRKPKLPSILDRTSAGSFPILFKSNKHVADTQSERDDDQFMNAFELKPITYNQTARTQMLPSIQQIVTPSNSPSPQPHANALLGHKNEFFDTCASGSSISSISAPTSRKGSIASILNVEEITKPTEQVDIAKTYEHANNDILTNMDSIPQPTAIMAPRGRPPHSVSGNRKRRMTSECTVKSNDDTGVLNKGVSDLGERDRKRYRSASSNKSYHDHVIESPPPIQQQRAVGLRHFSQQVCKKVREKQVTTYNAVADELASDIQSYYAEGQYDQKNIRRRVYDALNVLMAMGIIAKDRKEIRWLGLSGLHQPSAKELAHRASKKALEDQKMLEQKIKALQQSVKDTRQTLVHKVKQYTLFRNLIKRNIAAPAPSSKQLALPLIAMRCKRSKTQPANIHTITDETSITVSGNLSVRGLTNDTNLMERMGLNQINTSQYNRWFRSSWHPFCSSLVLTDSQ